MSVKYGNTILPWVIERIAHLKDWDVSLHTQQVQSNSGVVEFYLKRGYEKVKANQYLYYPNLPYYEMKLTWKSGPRKVSPV